MLTQVCWQPPLPSEHSSRSAKGRWWGVSTAPWHTKVMGTAWDRTYFCLTSVIPRWKKGECLMVQGMKAKHSRSGCRDHTASLTDGLVLQKGTPDQRERGFPCPRKPKAPRMLIQDAGCSWPLLPAPQSLLPAGDACTSLGGAGKP